MNKFAYLIICTVFFSGYLSSNVHKVFALAPEFLSLVTFLIILLRLAAYKTATLNPKYVVLGVIAGLHILAGLVLNSVEPGTIVTGMRPYIKWVPIFLLPAVYPFSEREISGQLRLILFLAMAQCPVAIYQRLFQYKSSATGTGDVITGTLGYGASGALSILLLSTIAILLAHYLRKRIRLITFTAILGILFLPTMINETKVTLILLPIILVIPYIYASKETLSLSRLAGVATLGLVLLVGFVSVYDQIASQWNGQRIRDFMATQIGSYLYSETEFGKEDLLTPNRIGNTILPKETIGSKEGGGKIDNALLPIEVLSHRPIHMWLGLGVGNTSPSITKAFSGAYSRQLGKVSGGTLLSFLLWETGVGGVLLLTLFIVFLLFDTYKASKADNAAGILASGWMGVLAVVLITVPYTNIFYFNALVFLFAYFSGYFASSSMRMKQQFA